MSKKRKWIVVLKIGIFVIILVILWMIFMPIRSSPLATFVSYEELQKKTKDSTLTIPDKYLIVKNGEQNISYQIFYGKNKEYKNNYILNKMAHSKGFLANVISYDIIVEDTAGNSELIVSADDTSERSDDFDLQKYLASLTKVMTVRNVDVYVNAVDVAYDFAVDDVRYRVEVVESDLELRRAKALEIIENIVMGATYIPQSLNERDAH